MSGEGEEGGAGSSAQIYTNTQGKQLNRIPILMTNELISVANKLIHCIH